MKSDEMEIRNCERCESESVECKLYETDTMRFGEQRTPIWLCGFCEQTNLIESDAPITPRTMAAMLNVLLKQIGPA